MKNELWEILIAIVAALGGWQFVKYMLNLNSNRRMAAAEAYKVEYAALIEDYKRTQKEVDDTKNEVAELKAQVKKLYKEIDALKEDRLSLIKENGELKLKLMEAEHNVCMRPDGDCVRRLPARSYCALYQVAEGRLISDEARKDKKEHEKDSEDNGIPEEPREGEQP